MVRATEKRDQFYWLPNSNGVYIVKSGYKWLMHDTNIILGIRAVKMWRSMWSLHVLTRWKLLMWKTFHDALPTDGNQ